MIGMQNCFKTKLRKMYVVITVTNLTTADLTILAINSYYILRGVPSIDLAFSLGIGLRWTSHLSRSLENSFSYKSNINLTCYGYKISLEVKFDANS